MFLAIDYLFRLVGNFGVAILLVTVLIKIMFFPLANKSYASMAKMKNIQPEMVALRERYPDDKQKQQQEMMELYKREKINPGCRLPADPDPDPGVLRALQGAVRHHRNAPRAVLRLDQGPVGAGPDQPVQPVRADPVRSDDAAGARSLPALGVWPIIMGITMWVQMKLNPAPPDPTQKMIFDWMPLIFTFMLASFPAGLVIYWAWNNLLSVIQQSIIMKKNGAKIELFDNIKSTFARRPIERRAASRRSSRTTSRQAGQPRRDEMRQRLIGRCAGPSRRLTHDWR